MSKQELTLQQKIKQYAFIDLTPDLSDLSEDYQSMLWELMNTKPIFDSMYIQLNARRGLEIQKLMKEILPHAKDKLEEQITEYLTYFDINKGHRDMFTTEKFLPDFDYHTLYDLASITDRNLADRLVSLRDDIFKPGFVETGVYPAGTTIEKLKEMQQSEGRMFNGKLDVICADEDGGWIEIPYTEYFRDELTAIDDIFQKASAHANNASDAQLAKKLSLLGEALTTGDFKDYWKFVLTEFDVSKSPVNVHFNFEEYDDQMVSTGENKWSGRWMKGFWHFMVALRDDEATRLYGDYTHLMTELEKNLPFEKARRAQTNFSAPSAYYRTLMDAAGMDSGYKFVAMVMPNKPFDIDGREKLGFFDPTDHKKVIIEGIVKNCLDKNIAEKYDSSLTDNYLGFSAFTHEGAHSLGHQCPEYTNLENRESFEEAKAETGSIYILKYMADHNTDPKYQNRLEMVADYMVANHIRQTRFGTGSAHAKAAVMIQDALIEEGAIEIRDGRVYGDTDKIIDVTINKIYKDLLTIASTANQDLIEKYGSKTTMNADMAKVIETKTTGIPRDIRFNINQTYAGRV